MRQRTIVPAQVLECLRLSRAKLTPNDIARTLGPDITAGQVGDILDALTEHHLVERTDRKKYPPLFGLKNRGN
jgi:DNA-binding IclR family transcriptional regulator